MHTKDSKAEAVGYHHLVQWLEDGASPFLVRIWIKKLIHYLTDLYIIHYIKSIYFFKTEKI